MVERPRRCRAATLDPLRPAPVSSARTTATDRKLCLLVMIGVRVDGTNELISLAEGYRESSGSWAVSGVT
jgi:hypothetical protein